MSSWCAWIVHKLGSGRPLGEGGACPGAGSEGDAKFGKPEMGVRAVFAARHETRF